MIALGSTAFLLFGVVLVLVGASQDALARALGLDLARSGLLASVLSLGIGAGMLAAGPLVDRLPRRPLFAGSTLVAGLALVAVEAELSFARLLAHVALVGFAGGVYDVLLNVVAVQRWGASAARPVTLLHSAATAGAVAGPLIVIGLSRVGDWTAGFRATGAAYLLFTLWAMAVPLEPPVRHAARRPRGRLRSPALVGLLVVAFAYLGVETAVTIFAVPYASDGLGLAADRGRAAISAFWLGLLLGRLALVAWPGRIDAGMLAGGGLAAGALLAAGVLGRSAHVEWIVGAVGFAIGGVFPLMVTLAAQRAPAGSAGMVTGLVAGLGCLGGFAVPWLTGALGDAAGVRVALGSLAGWCLLIAAAGWAVRRSRATGADPAVS